VLTDGTGYELGQGNISLDVPDAPLWLVHLGGGFRSVTMTPTLRAVQASGGEGRLVGGRGPRAMPLGRMYRDWLTQWTGIWETLPTSESKRTGR
jgi:hypothetical protein